MKFAQMNRDTQYLIATLLYTLEDRIEMMENECDNPKKIALSIMLVGQVLHGESFKEKWREEILHGLMESNLGKNKIQALQKADPEKKKREARAAVEIEFTDFIKEHLPTLALIWDRGSKSAIETMRRQIAILDEKYEGFDIRQNLSDIEDMKKLHQEFNS